MLHRRKLLRIEYSHRMPSALHRRLNKTSNTISITLEKGATAAVLSRMNRVCEAHKAHLHFKEAKKYKRAKKPTGST